MSENTKTLQTTTFLLGIVCFLWIIYDIIKINSDLKSVIFFDTTGKIVGIGYLLIFSFHILALIIFFKCLHNKKKYRVEYCSFDPAYFFIFRANH